MPELPEVEIVARVLASAVKGARVESVLVRGVNTLRSFEPPLERLTGAAVAGMRRRGKLLIVDFDNGLSLVLHLMSAGRLGLLEEVRNRDRPDRTTRVLLIFEDGRALRLQERGTRQSSWIKLVETGRLEHEPTLAALGPDAWPDPPDLGILRDQPRPLHTLLRDQRIIAGIGRSWVDEILHRAMLSPYKRGDDLTQRQAEALRTATSEVLGSVVDLYDRTVGLPLPDRLPMPLAVHGRTGSPCPRCGTTLEAVHFEDHDMTYCPACQTGGRRLKDRRLSRLLK